MLSSLVGAIFPINSDGMTWRRFVEHVRLVGDGFHFLEAELLPANAVAPAHGSRTLDQHGSLRSRDETPHRADEGRRHWHKLYRRHRLFAEVVFAMFKDGAGEFGAGAE